MQLVDVRVQAVRDRGASERHRAGVRLAFTTRMFSRASIAVIALSLSAAACGGSKTAPATTAPAPAQPAPTMTPAHDGHGSMAAMCPMQVPGTQISTAETPDGIAIVLTTSGDVSQLRESAHHMAERHEHMMSGGMKGGGEMMKMVPSKARAEEIEGGARIVLTPNDPTQLAELRDHVLHHVDQMKTGQCPMMHPGA